MSPLVIVVPHDAGVDATDANRAILDLIQARVNDTRREIMNVLAGMNAINQRVAEVATMSEEFVASEFANFDTQLEHLMKLRYTLHTRVDAYLTQRRAIDTPSADDPFADPIPQTKVT